MGANDESFLDLLDTDGANYDMDELDVDKILGTSATNGPNNKEKEKGKSAAVATQSQQRVSTGSHRKREQEEHQPAEHRPVKEKKRVEYQPQPQLLAADDAMEEDGEEEEVKSSSSGRAKRPRIQLPEERETTIRASSSSKSATKVFKFRGGATGDEVRMQRKLRFSGADHCHGKSNKGGGGEIDDIRARRAAR
jgi:hypothetical protein